MATGFLYRSSSFRLQISADFLGPHRAWLWEVVDFIVCIFVLFRI